MSFICLLIFLSGLGSILLNRMHFLIMLLCLEYMYMGVLFNIFMNVGYLKSFFLMVVVMFFIVCEAGLGLSILVNGIYFYGNDKVSSNVLLKC
uniref:NADH dehydrogenase subunit 4L n=1 Tax=Alectorobius rudis TaxID=2058922 RepID=UPI002237A6EC|nr:NADH dehydrogenase subunit 4L [Alectorobius rudis]UYB78622.1 NADH dehydrogenase subunit 4L [Alectorobius rudis]UYB78635.1 NADH dehydrogenase subunit 4L [Alectorobius rudis]